MQFLGLSDHMPDFKTIRLFCEHLTQADVIDVLFNRFNTTLRNFDYLLMLDKPLDVTLVAFHICIRQMPGRESFGRDAFPKTGKMRQSHID